MLAPFDIFKEQYFIAVEYHDIPIFIRGYLQKYFNVSLSFVEDRIAEIAYGIPLSLESTNPQDINPNNDILLFTKKDSPQ